MEARPTETTGAPAGHAADPEDARREALAWTAVLVIVAVASLAAVVVLIAAARHETAAPVSAPSAETALTSETTFAIFDEFHATVVVSPAVVGDNTIEIVLARHDGSPAEATGDVTVSAALTAQGIGPTVYTAEPVEGTPGSYWIADASFSEAGEWELTFGAAAAGSEPRTKTLLVPIGAP